MGGKRSKRRGKGGGGRRKEDGFSVEGHSQNSAREPPLKQQQQQKQQRGRGSDNNGVNLPLYNSAREPPEEKQQQQQRSQYKHVIGRSSTSNRQPQEPPTSNQYTKYSDGNTNNSANNSTRRTVGRNKILSSIRRQDPPQDETRSVSSRHSSTSRNNNNNVDRRDRRKPNGHFNYYEHQYHGDDDENDSPLLDMQEQIQYDHYQDQHYHQQFLHPQQTNYRQDESPAYSSSHRQFNLAPINVEMTTFNSRERKAKKDERRLRQQQKAQQSTFSLGRYETVNSSNHSSDNASDSDYDFDYNSGDSDDESSDNEITTHEEFYNYDDDDDDDDTDDEDEERPLRRSRTSNKLRQNRDRSQPIMTRCERYQNRALLVAFALVAVLFIRDQTPWWKRHQARVEYQKHHHHHKDGSDDDDSVRKTQLDPFTVYNSNDDDSTHTRDHDPLHKYVKEGETKLDPDAVAAAHGSSSHEDLAENSASDATKENKYDEHTAGERISDRPAQKSLNHGFMDENYEDRPGAKNSASTSLAAAGVKIGSTGGLDEEEASFLKSVKGRPEGYNSGYGVGGDNEQMIPPPPSNQDTPTETSTPRPESEDNTMQSSPADTNVDEVGFSGGKVSSFPSEVQTQQQSQQQQQKSPNDSDNLVEWGDPQRQNDGNGANLPPQSPQFNSFQPDSAVPDFKPMANEAMSGSAFMSNSLNAQSGKQIKDVYKNSYYRWNHPFRANADGDSDGRDIPVFWRIPRSASSIMENVIVNCYHLSLASALGTRQGHDQDKSLGIVAVGNAKYVNVDMSNPAGIARASAMHLGAYDMVDAISTPFLYETASIFQDVPNSGKCFTLLRHPVDRAVSLYHHYQSEDSNPNTLQYKGLSIDEFAEQTTESNWMVRFLTNKRAGALSWHDLEAAKEMFGRKCLVGLVEKAEESIRRFERFFRWGDSNYNACVGERLANSDKRNQHDSFEGTNAWEVLRKKNEYDVLLYEYAKNLYTQQSTMYEPH